LEGEGGRERWKKSEMKALSSQKKKKGKAIGSYGMKWNKGGYWGVIKM